MCSTYFGQNVIPELTQQRSPSVTHQSPFSPLQSSPSPSTTLDSSEFDLESNEDQNDEDAAISFKLPQKGSQIRAIFNYIKQELVSRGFRGMKWTKIHCSLK